jgi:hypothetical protein
MYKIWIKKYFHVYFLLDIVIKAIKITSSSRENYRQDNLEKPHHNMHEKQHLQIGWAQWML